MRSDSSERGLSTTLHCLQWYKLVLRTRLSTAAVHAVTPTRLSASMHWLRVPERVQYKITVLVYKVLHGLAPQYLGPLSYVADLPGR